jgi:hypothetical protein
VFIHVSHPYRSFVWGQIDTSTVFLPPTILWSVLECADVSIIGLGSLGRWWPHGLLERAEEVAEEIAEGEEVAEEIVTSKGQAGLLDNNSTLNGQAKA